MKAATHAPLLAVLLLLSLARVGVAQFAAPSVLVRTTPDAPARGSVAWLRIEDDPARNDQPGLTDVGGEAAGEPLHFERGGRGFAALIGLPVDGGDTLPVALRLSRTGRVDSTLVGLVVRHPSYPTERLRVPPGMVQYDSAIRARVDAELAQAREISRRSHETPRLWSAPLTLPRESRITSPFGGAREYNGRVTSRHLGTDFAGAVGTPVSAAARGVVALVADFYLAGRAVYLDHGAGLVTGYFHLSRASVAEGDTVAAGQRIGAVGRTGRVTGPHLHWIMRYGGISVDPMTLVELGRSDELVARP
ncbi:MAG: M23 family metallopeptidase [Gemmatimonadales bacterium]|nr:M23 family metallopeptidase [Gemmatimonadales bacterium]